MKKRNINKKKANALYKVIALMMPVIFLSLILAASFPALDMNGMQASAEDNVVVLRICNWEEYIDEGEWDEEELIDLESGDIFSESSMVEDFEEWYYEETGIRVSVEYSCFGSNEELYNMLTLGTEFDLVCPSDYMIMKLMAEDELLPYSDDFFDTDNEENYYAKGVSPYIKQVFDENEIGGEPWSKYAAGYMWGVTGILYNPEYVSEEDASTWAIINNEKYNRQITIKDNVRDSLFAAIGAINSDILLSDSFKSADDYQAKLATIMNDVSEGTIAKAQDYLQDTQNNVYSFESDSGKADMVTGKVVANYQWSGDGVYAMDQAEEEGLYLAYAVPEECTNLWFDGWVMLKDGIGEDEQKQAAAEAFVNFLSMPENVVRNMYYIGYTSVIAGGDDDTVFEYLDWCYGAEEDEEDVIDYPVGYFFSGDEDDEDYVITACSEQSNRQLFAQYPTSDVIERSAIMEYFDPEANARINQMWINVRCYNIKDMGVAAWAVFVLCLAGVLTLLIKARKLN